MPYKKSLKDVQNEIAKSDKSLKIGWFRTAGGGVPSVPLLLENQETLQTKFVSSSAYENIWFYSQSKFDTQVKPILDLGMNCNYFFEFVGPDSNVATANAQLPLVINGSYDSRVNQFLDHLIAYNLDRENKGLPIKEVRLVIFHEINIVAYPWGFGMNRTTPNDWSSAAVTPARGLNNQSDYPAAVAKVRALINAKAATNPKLNDQVKICLTMNFSYSRTQDITAFLPARSDYDYWGIDVYDRFQAIGSPAFFHTNFLYIVKTGFNKIYEQLSNASDAPILITEMASSSNTTKYNRADWYIQALNDIKTHLPRIQEWTYFWNDDASWALSANDLTRIRNALYGIGVIGELDVHVPVIKPNILTRDLSNLANWLVAGTNAGVVSITNNTTSTGTGTDENRKNAQTIQLTHSVAGTNPLDNYVYFTENASIYEANIPHVLTFQANSNVDNTTLAVGLVNASNPVAGGIEGNQYIKLGRKAKTYRVGVCGGLLADTVRVVFGIGNNTATARNLYIDRESIKLEKGEIGTPNFAIPTTTGATVNVLNKKIFSVDMLASNTTEQDLYNVLLFDIGTATLAANLLRGGDQIKISSSGVYTTSATPPTLILRPKIAGTTMLASSPIALPASQTNRTFKIEIDYSVRAIGVFGVVTMFARIDFEGLSPIFLTTLGSITVDTTATALLQLTGQWSTSEVGNTIRTRIQATTII